MKIKKIITLVACVCLLSILLVIPAFAVVTESSGDGYALYNGYKLPNLPVYDTVSYPYIVIGDYGDGEIELLLSPVPFVMIMYGGALGYAPQYDSELVAYVCDNSSTWEYAAHFDAVSDEAVSSANAIWTNHNLLTTDNTIYLAASYPISLDGYNLIEWNGDITGLEMYDDYCYCVVEEYIPAVSAFSVMDLSYSQFPVVFDGFTAENNANGALWYIEPPTSSYYYSAASELYDNFGATCFLKFDDIDDTGYTKMLAYRPVESPPDEGGGEDDDPHPPCGG